MKLSKFFLLDLVEVSQLLANENAGLPRQPPSERGADGYTQWLSAFRKRIARVDDHRTRRMLVACTDHLLVGSFDRLHAP